MKARYWNHGISVGMWYHKRQYKVAAVVGLFFQVSSALHVGTTARSGYRFKRVVNENERKSLDSFYRQHFRNQKRVAPPAPKARDEVYSLMDNECSIVAAVRLCPARSQFVFLRSLCVSRNHRRQGAALLLIQEALHDYNMRQRDAYSCFCFAENRLRPLYEKAGFSIIMNKDCVPEWMWRSYELVAKRMKRKHQDMRLFIKDATKQPTIAMQVVLLQHSNEVKRPTSTARLFFAAEAYNERRQDPLLSEHVTVDKWIWSGRNDTKTIENNLKQIIERQGMNPVLVWTGAGNTTFHNSDQTAIEASTPLFIVLDGTWQEARGMFRKLYCLQKLPRHTIMSQSPSQYRLRKDYSGWRYRFGGGNHGENLLCTAEVIAALLNDNGNKVGGTLALNRLDEFQDAFKTREGARLGSYED